MPIKNMQSGKPVAQYGYIYLARWHGIRCLGARAALQAGGESRSRATYFAKVLKRLPRPPLKNPGAEADTFDARAAMPII